MIKNIIFDFGDVFMDLDKTATPNALQKLGLIWDEDWKKIDVQLEIGQISHQDFLQKLKDALPKATEEEILKAWNAVMVHFPSHRLDFLEKLTKNYRLFLLSNTDYIHFRGFESMCGKTFSDRFYNCFEACYYSYALGIKKPNTGGFEHILNQHQLSPLDTLFVDDNSINTATAKSLGMHTWTVQKGQQDVNELFEQDLPF